MSPILLAAISTSFWAAFDASRKKLVGKVEPQVAAISLMLVQSAIFFILLLSTGEFPNAIHSDYWWPFWVSCIINGLGHIFFLESVKRAPLSLAIPILSITPIFASLGSWVWLDEVLLPRQMLGVLVVVFGAGGFGWLGRQAEKSDGVVRGLILMFLTAVLWAFTPVVDKICLTHVPLAFHALLQSFTIAGMLLGLWVVRNRSLKIGLGLRIPTLWWSGAFAAAALGVQMLSISSMSVGLFEAFKRALGLLLALALGRILFSEPLNKQKLGFAALMSLGFFLLFG